MGGLLFLILIGFVIEFWRVFLVLIAVWAVACVVTTLWDRGAAERADRARHQQARREIDRIARATTRAMSEAALRHGPEVIEATAVEVVADE